MLSAFSIILSSCKSTATEGEAKRPNILFAFADDWGKYASCYAKVAGANPVQRILRTPNVDRLAKEGVLFTQAFVNAPSCTPCRSSLLSGQHFYRTGLGAILQGAIWNDSIPTYPLLLEENGYHIGYTYKVWTPGTPRDAGYGGLEKRYQNSGNFNAYSQNVERYMSEEDLTLVEAKEKLHQEVRENFQSFLEANTKDQPFCYWWGPTNTHRKWVYGSGKDMWGIDPEDLRGKMPAFLPDVDTVRADFADYLGEVMAFDAGLGVILEELEKRGELDNTLIVVSGDHGFPGFSNGKCNLYDAGTQVPLIVRWPSQVPADRIVDDLVSLPDLAPTFLEAAQVTPPSEMTGKSLLPILKTSKSGLIESDRDFVITGRERHVRKARAELLPYPQRALRTQEWLYIINFEPDRYPMGDPKQVDEQYEADIDELTNNTFAAFGDYDASPTKAWLIAHRREEGVLPFYQFAFGKRPAEELYAVKKDAYQVENLAQDSAYQTIKKELRAKLLEELRKTKDPRLQSPTPFEHPPYAREELDKPTK
ncbi:MAG: sulfatase [Saprospiraceae bacterium]|nr:sulfatase [Saprospiraceae bacterium]